MVPRGEDSTGDKREEGNGNGFLDGGGDGREDEYE